jgi:hypothetical protein
VRQIEVEALRKLRQPAVAARLGADGSWARHRGTAVSGSRSPRS